MKPREDQNPLPLLDKRGRARTPTMMPGTGGHAGRAPANKGRKMPPQLLERSEIERLLEGCTSDTPGRRVAATIALCYRTGISAGEARNLRVQDFSPEPEASVWIAAGKQQERTLAVDEQAGFYLQRWMEVRRDLPGEALFCVVRPPTVGAPMSAEGFRDALRAVTQRVKLTSRVHMGAFRHTFAAELFTEQWPLLYIQAQLGITGMSSMEDFFRDLNLERPTEEEVLFAARLRPEWKHHSAPTS